MAATGYSYKVLTGENLAAGYQNAAAVMKGWKDSPTHNAVMLDPDFKVIGVALVHVEGSPLRLLLDRRFRELHRQHGACRRLTKPTGVALSLKGDVVRQRVAFDTHHRGGGRPRRREGRRRTAARDSKGEDQKHQQRGDSLHRDSFLRIPTRWGHTGMIRPHTFIVRAERQDSDSG